MPSNVYPLDLVDIKSLEFLSTLKTDICLIFKALDGLERIKRDMTLDLFRAIDTSYYAVTFPTLTISGHREIKEHRRQWLERLLERHGWVYKKFLLESELLYVIKKGK